MTQLYHLFITTLTAPRQAAAYLAGLGLDIRAGVAGLVVTVILGVLVLFTLNGFQPVGLMMGMAPLSPITFVAMVLISNLLLMGAILITGRIFGGTGTFETGLIFFAWLQFIQLGIQITLAVLALILGPGLAAFASLASIVIVFWITFNFISVLHGFDAIWKAIVTFVLAIIALAFAVSILLTIAGVQPPQVTL